MTSTAGQPGRARSQVPTEVLFVCTGNVCRSPFAERYAAFAAESGGVDCTFASAGLGALRDAQMDADMAQQLRARGGTPQRFHARQIDARIVAAADLVLTMEAAQRSVLLEEYPGRSRDIFTLGQVRAGAAQDAPGTSVLELLRTRRVPADGGGDIADPYRQGPEAAERTAAELQSAVDVLVARVLTRPDSEAGRDV